MPRGFSGLELQRVTDCVAEPLAISPPLHDTSPLNLISAGGQKQKEKKTIYIYMLEGQLMCKVLSCSECQVQNAAFFMSWEKKLKFLALSSFMPI